MGKNYFAYEFNNRKELKFLTIINIIKKKKKKKKQLKELIRKLFDD